MVNAWMIAIIYMITWGVASGLPEQFIVNLNHAGQASSGVDVCILVECPRGASSTVLIVASTGLNLDVVVSSSSVM